MEQAIIDYLDKFEEKLRKTLLKLATDRKALDGKLVIGDETTLCVPALSRITRTMDNGDKVKVLIVKKE